MPKEKILNIIHTESSCGWGGQEIRILTESAGMIARGHNVHIVCPKESNIYKEAIKRNIPVTALPIARKKIQAIFTLRKWLKKNPADIINTHSSTDSWLVALAIQFYKNAPVMVRTRHVSAPIANNMATRWLYTSASHYIVTTGEKLRQTLINTNHYPEKKIVSIPTGVDTNRFKPHENNTSKRVELNLPTNRFIIGIVATIRSWKGHIYLIEAIAKLNNPDIHLLIVGDGPSRPIIKEALEKHELTSQTTLAGNQDNVVPYLQSMDLFVLPSYANEGVPQGIIQAMLCQLAIISTPIGSITEAVIDGETGIIVPERNVDKLSKAIKQLMETEQQRTQYAKQGRIHALQYFSIDIMLERMEKIFRMVLNTKGTNV